MRKHFLLSLLTLPIFNLLAQDINVKVKESTFEDKPAIEKEAQFEPANFFLMGGVGMGYRTGNVIARFRADPGKESITLPYRSTDENSKFKLGLVFEVGGSYYFENNFGIGLRASLFSNNIDFIELGSANNKSNNNANAKTEIYSGLLEGLYRIHFSKQDKTGFFYGGIGIGATSISQLQTYKASNRKTTVSESTLAVRPSAGVNVPLYDRFHFYSEVGFLIGNKKTPDGNLSLSQFQLTAGVQIRLNSF